MKLASAPALFSLCSSSAFFASSLLLNKRPASISLIRVTKPETSLAVSVSLSLAVSASFFRRVFFSSAVESFSSMAFNSLIFAFTSSCSFKSSLLRVAKSSLSLSRPASARVSNSSSFIRLNNLSLSILKCSSLSTALVLEVSYKDSFVFTLSLSPDTASSSLSISSFFISSCPLGRAQGIGCDMEPHTGQGSPSLSRSLASRPALSS